MPLSVVVESFDLGLLGILTDLFFVGDQIHFVLGLEHFAFHIGVIEAFYNL